MSKPRLALCVLLAGVMASIVTFAARSGRTAGSTSNFSPPTSQTGFTILSPAAGSVVPCGQPVTVTWSGGNPSDNVNLLLIDVQAFQQFQGFGVEPNTGSRVVTIGPGSCGRQSLFYLEDVPRTTWTYGPAFDVACSNTVSLADGDVAGLIAAINSANASACPTTINLAPNGTYTLTDVADDGSTVYCCGPVGLPFVNSTVTINGNGATIQRSSAAGTPPFGIIRVAEPWYDPSSTIANLTLDGVTLTGAAGPTVVVWGGSTAMIRNTTITNNASQGILTWGGDLTVLNSTISYNNGTFGYGGGGILHIGNGTTAISFSTIFENQAGGVGDAIATAFSDPGRVTVKNSILASPTRGRGLVCWVNGGDAIASLGHNIGGDSSCGPGSNAAPGGLTGPGDMNDTNPLLGPLANNGGPTPTHLPLCNSPAINGVPITDSSDVNGVPITMDQRGVSRPSGAAFDIGSVEVATSVTVTIPSTAGPWDTTLNPGFDYGVHNNGAPLVIDASTGISFTAGGTVTVTYLNGTVQAGSGYPFTDANGIPGNVTNHYTGGNNNFPALYMNPGPDVNSMALVGTFANNGVVVGNPFLVGNGPATFTIPAGANQLLLGINDNYYGDNSGSFTVAVTGAGSSTPPTVSCPSPTTASADSNCQARVPDVIAGVTASGGCGGSVTLSQSPAAGTLVGVGTTTITVTATDAFNNSASCTTSFTVTDNTPPTVSCPAPSTASADANCQAHVPDVLASVNASDCDGPVTLSQSPAAGTLVGLGATTITVTAKDAANNSTTCSTSFTVTDNTPPTITITAPSNNATYLLNQSIAAGYSCADCGGVASCVGPVASGSNINTASVGAKSFTVSASDNAGNHATRSANYTVSYAIRALFDQSKAAKSGSTIPIKLQLVDANGNNVSSPAVVVHAVSVVQASSSASGMLDDAGQANPDFDFRFDSSLGGYIFNLKTTGYGTGSYLLSFSVGGDPTSHSIPFQVRQ